jgi:hypothetical protein
VSIARQAQAHTRDADEASHWALPPLARDASEKAKQVQGIRYIIHGCITPAEDEFGSPFALWRKKTATWTVDRFAVVGRPVERYGAGR